MLRAGERPTRCSATGGAGWREVTADVQGCALNHPGPAGHPSLRKKEGNKAGFVILLHALNVRGDPVGDVVDADLAVVHLRVVCAAVRGGEDFQVLAL